MLGSGLDFDGLRGGLRVDLATEWRAVMVVVWVRLGAELRGFYWELGALVLIEKKDRRGLFFSGRMRGFGLLKGGL